MKAKQRTSCPLPPQQQTGHQPSHLPATVQTKRATGASNNRRPVAPPVYRPQPSTAAAVQPAMANAGQPNRKQPSASASSRPQPGPRVLQAQTAGAQRPQTGQSPSARQPVAPPVYRPEAKKIVQPKIAAATATTTPPKAPPPYRPQPTPKVLQTKKAQAGASTTGQRHPATARGSGKLPGRNIIQAMFWEKTPEGKYVWHYGPVISRWWQATTEKGEGGYGVWLRKSAMKKTTAPVSTAPKKTAQSPVKEIPKAKATSTASSISSSPSASLSIPQPTPTPTLVPQQIISSPSASSSSLLPPSFSLSATPAYTQSAAVEHLLKIGFKGSTLGDVGEALREHFSGVPKEDKKLHPVLKALSQAPSVSVSPVTLSSGSSSSSSSSSAPVLVGGSSEPEFVGLGSEHISAEWQRHLAKKKPAKEGEIETYIGRVSGKSVAHGTGPFQQKGNSSVVLNHAEQLALDTACKEDGDVYLIQNAWPCSKCLEHFKTRGDIAARKVTITVTSDKGTYSADNKLKPGTIGQIIINRNIISYANLATIG